MNDMSSICNRHGILPTEHPYGMQMVMGIPNGCGCFLVFFYRHGNLPIEHPYGMRMTTGYSLPIEHPYRDADDHGKSKRRRRVMGIPNGCGCFLVFFYRHGNLPIEHPYRDADDYGIFPTDRASLPGCG